VAGGVRAAESSIEGIQFNMISRTFEDVDLWKKSHAWVLAIYRFADSFPRHELFGLSSQLPRSAVSIPANFAEGFKKRGKADKVRFYNIAQSSLEECRYYMILSRDLGYGETSKLLEGLEVVRRMLESYMRAVQRKGG
jgi:four helix bundle protein